jgi:hypothetical protein
MVNQVYSGYVVREAINGDGFICETKSEKRIYVKAYSEETAELLIHEVYGRNESKWTSNRTSDKFLGDKVYINNLRVEDDRSLEKLVEDSI